jgi:hypothetical protein
MRKKATRLSHLGYLGAFSPQLVISHNNRRIAFMKNSILAAVGLAVAATSFSVAAEAGPFDRLKKKAKEVEQTTNDAEDVADVATGKKRPRTSGLMRRGSNSGSPRVARPKSRAGKAGPTPAKFNSATQCANLGLSGAFVAQSGKYSFSQGISSQERTGLLNRVAVSPTGGCTFPAMGVFDVLYVEVDKAAYNRGSYALQCVSYDGKEQLDNTNAPPENNYKGKDVMLHSGNSTGYTPTATGSNSSRSGQYKKVLDGRGKEMITFNMPGLHTDSGTDFYCQHFDKNTGKSALAFTFRRGPTG